MNRVKQAVQLIRKGEKDEARTLLKAFLAENPDHEQAWLALATAARNKEELRDSLQQVLRLNPDNTTARRLARKFDIALPAADDDAFTDPNVTLISRGTDELPAVGAPGAEAVTIPPTRPARSRRRTLFWLVLFAMGVAVFVGLVMIVLLVMSGDDETTAQQAEATNIAATNNAAGTTIAQEATFQAQTLIPPPTPTPDPTQQATFIAATNAAITATNDARITQAAAATQAAITPTIGPITAHNGPIALVQREDSGAEIILFQPDDESLANLTQNPAIDEMPAWSPDGQWLAFVSDREGSRDIYIMRPDGSDLQRLTRDAANDQYPTWSPDGQAIAFASDRSGNFDIYIMTLAPPHEVQQLTADPAVDTFPAWSSDNRLVFASNRDGNFELYRVDTDGGNLQRLTENTTDDFNPVWSPDSQLIAFISQDESTRDIYVINSDGTNLANLTDSPDNEFSPAWSPDGRYLVFAVERPARDGFDIYRIDADGGNRQLLIAQDASLDTPSWGRLPE